MTIAQFRGDYAWLSNFWPTTVVWNNYPFHTVENAYQATKLFDPCVEAMRGIDFMRPAAAKVHMRGVPRPADHLKIMRRLLEQKFSHDDMRELLRSTGRERIVEGNYWGDTYWGVDLKTGKGESHLGNLIMQIRGKL